MMVDDRFLLKDLIDQPSVLALAEAVAAVHPDTAAGAVLDLVFDRGWPELELKQRIRHVARALRRVLPPDYPGAIQVLRQAAADVQDLGFAAMAFNDFVEEFGVDDPEVSLPALEQFTTLVSAARNSTFYRALPGPRVRPTLDLVTKRRLASAAFGCANFSMTLGAERAQSRNRRSTRMNFRRSASAVSVL